MRRFLLSKLIQWKENQSRKPLILQGARQVGKTYLLHEFGKKHYSKYFYYNFERDTKLKSLFSESLEPKDIITNLSFYSNSNIDPYNDLIIFDEIQECPDALTSLKYFCEDMPSSHICAAGSLLGVYLGPVSYPVGKVQHLKMYPMTFQEFLLALNQERLFELVDNFGENNIDTIPDLAHSKLWELFKYYLVVGGMPEVVDTFCNHQDNIFNAMQLVREKQSDLVTSYLADIAKHSGKMNAMQISRIWQSIPEQLAGTHDGSSKKYKFKNVVPGINGYNKLANAIDWLQSAGLIVTVPIVNSAKLPLKSYTKENTFKLFIFDTGLLTSLCNLDPKTVIDYDYGSYKGFVAENFVAQELIALNGLDGSLYSWSERTSEIEFITEKNSNLLPIEVKSGLNTQAKSLNIFIQKYNPEKSVILSANNFKINKSFNKYYIPLYLTCYIPNA